VRRALSWVVLGAATAALGWALERAGVPSSYLFAALLLGLGVALARPDAPEVPPSAFAAAQAVTGVTIGAYLQSSSLRAVGDVWLQVALVSAATLGVSIGAGLLLARVTRLDPTTAALGMIAGGASGIVAMSQELRGDDRLVAFMQYARVLVVVLLTPLLIPVVFPGHDGGGAAAGASAPMLGDAVDWIAVLGIAAMPPGARCACRPRCCSGR
jgi:membrane AbrB-like protein